MPTPARLTFKYLAQDDRGFRALMRINALIGDILTGTTTLASIGTAAASIGTAVQACTNAKIVETGFSITFDYAQEPTTETGTYQLVNQGAHLEFGDGRISKEFLTIPAPVDAMFLTTSQDNLIVVNPASSQITGLQSATSGFASIGDGTVFAQFFGGQLRAQKPRRRRVLQGA